MMMSLGLKHGLAVTSLLAIGNLALACGSDSDFDDDDGGFGPLDCCDAECVSTVGNFTFRIDGETTTVSGTATITEVSTGTLLVDAEMTGWPTLESTSDDTTLAPFEGQMIEVDVAVQAVGFAPFSQRFMLDVQSQEVCCSSCISASGSFDIELGMAANTFLDGCNPGGGDPACPLTLPSTFDSCSAALCCNYDAGDDAVIGCICNSNGTGWICEQSACACTGS
jgi:hypothetical protein